MTTIPEPGTNLIAFTAAELLFKVSSSAFVRGRTETAPPTRVLKPAGALKTPRAASVARYRPTIAPPGFTSRVTPAVVTAGSLIVIGG